MEYRKLVFRNTLLSCDLGEPQLCTANLSSNKSPLRSELYKQSYRCYQRAVQDQYIKNSAFSFDLDFDEGRSSDLELQSSFVSQYPRTLSAYAASLLRQDLRRRRQTVTLQKLFCRRRILRRDINQRLVTTGTPETEPRILQQDLRDWSRQGGTPFRRQQQNSGKKINFINSTFSLKLYKLRDGFFM